MELKKYQKRVISDLSSYLSFLTETDSLSEAYREFWASKQVPVGFDGIPAYQNIIDQVPHVCYKVPTGGGKTLLACASIKPIIDSLRTGKPKAVVWLVPSDAILTQTLAALKDPHHLYRQQLNLDFGSHVEVYSKEELLAGQNFSPATVAEQLSVMVLSYDSFRSKTKDGRKAFQANGALEAFRRFFGMPDLPIEGADEAALFQVLNQLEPVVIVDESHHARSELSKEMLRNFNPSFVLDLTATPKAESNIISYVDALALKAENMVKLPVVVYNKATQTDVITDAIDIRRVLEREANANHDAGGDYIRPIALFQAQPRAAADATSFERVRMKLVEAGVPEDQIAIKTAEVNELKNVDLLSPECPIRFIITVNALKEGWDCPFAYVLASLANKTSTVDVEQILGRILRQPHTRRHASGLLNMSYVLTSSNDFQATVDNVVSGLNAAGFTSRDYRLADELPIPDVSQVQELLPAPADIAIQEQEIETGQSEEELANFDVNVVARRIGSHEMSDIPETVEVMVRAAEELNDDYENTARASLAAASHNDLPIDLEDKVPHYGMLASFEEEARKIRIPQFYVPVSDLLASIEYDSGSLLSPPGLTSGFSLKGRDSNLDITHAIDQIESVDVRKDNADTPKAFKMNARQQQELFSYFDSLPEEGRVRQACELVIARLDKPRYDCISTSDLKEYVTRVVENLDGAQLKTLETSPLAVANKVRERIDSFLTEYRLEQFEKRLDDESIQVRSTYQLPASITLSAPTTSVGGSLYEAEGSMNTPERDLIMSVAALDNVAWWHRVNEKAPGEFYINGPINHYPDFIVCTTKGKIIMVESKGEHLKNDDSRAKIKLGEKWANAAGPTYRYYMVFKDGVDPLPGAFTTSDFLGRLENL